MSIVGNMEFPPSVWDSEFRRWADKGLCTISSLFSGTDFKSFTQLEEQCIEDYVIILAEKHLPIKKHVSHLYKRLINDTLQNTESIKGKWELELNVIIMDNVWEELRKIVIKDLIASYGENLTGN